jgi:hypothetical protein
MKCVLRKNLVFFVIFILFFSGIVSTSIAINNSNDENYNLIIITFDKFSKDLQSLREHKERYGITTKIVKLDDIYSSAFFEVEGRDDQEKIKFFIKNAMETWNTTYVLFIGNYKQIPVRYCYNNDGYSSSETNFISELYFADIYDENDDFSSWDSDGDGIFGEWAGDEAEDKPIDMIPDVCLGRLACKNSREVRIMINKIINYEKQSADPSWFKRIGVCGGDTYQEYPGYEGEIYNQMAIDIMNDFTPVKLWASNGYLAEKGWNIIKLINQGCGFLYLSGHGSPSTWTTKSSEGDWIGDFNQFMMPFLFNYNKLPVCLVGGCHNSQFDTDIINLLKNPKESFYQSTWLPECWSWRLTSHPRGGAIATIGSTGLCWYGIEYGGGGTDWLNIQFFREYANDTVALGQIWKNVLTRFVQTFPIDWETSSGGVSSIDAKSVQEWVLLGDPSLKIGGYS